MPEFVPKERHLMNNENNWPWIWPSVGATPVNQGMDSEMFDTQDIPFSETVVREALQNSLDAASQKDQPVNVRFSFHEDEIGERKAFVQGIIENRKQAGLYVPEAWNKGRISWLTVEDFNTTGLTGSLNRRLSDFWNYWLNFGISNKDCKGRGGRGIGRVTFLISSQVHAVIGYTRREEDLKTVACGMTVLKAIESGSRLLSTHAYLAESDQESVYDLYDTPDFKDSLKSSFGLQGYGTTGKDNGLALIIPYPHEELTPDGILASAIEHFAPAIIAGSLTLAVDDDHLNASTIVKLAERVSPQFGNTAITNDTGRFIRMIKAAHAAERKEISLDSASREKLRDFHDDEVVKALQTQVEEDKLAAFKLNFPLKKQDGTESMVSALIAVQRTPEGRRPLDRFFRGGMSLPYVRAGNPGELDVVILVEDVSLATYLNLCEGKAHLELLESKEIKEKLQNLGYRVGFQEKRLVNALPVEIRQLMTPEITKPDANVFEGFFSIPSDQHGEKEDKIDDGDNDDIPPPPPPPPPKPKIFKVTDLEAGLKVSANPDYEEWPVNLSITLAYADGSRKPAWSKHDFELSDLNIVSNDCKLELVGNKVRALNCGPDAELEITGFDTRRELDTRIGAWKDA
jgi:hypothetical protein